MNRKDFIQKLVRATLLLLLSGLVLVLSKKMVYKKDCQSCPEYASCRDTNNCKLESSK